jgi:hypothetical protein
VKDVKGFKGVIFDVVKMVETAILSTNNHYFDVLPRRMRLFGQLFEMEYTRN